MFDEEILCLEPQGVYAIPQHMIRHCGDETTVASTAGRVHELLLRRLNITQSLGLQVSVLNTCSNFRHRSMST